MGCLVAFEQSVLHNILSLCMFYFMKARILSFLFSLIWYGFLSKTLDFEPNDWGWNVSGKSICPIWMTIPKLLSHVGS